MVDKRAISLVRSLMASDPMIRYSVHDAQRHDWLTTNATELQELYDRKLRKVQWKLDGNWRWKRLNRQDKEWKRGIAKHGT